MGKGSCVRPFGPCLWQVIFVSAALITTIHSLPSALRIDTATGKRSSVTTIAFGDRPVRVDLRKPFTFNDRSIYSVWIHRDGFLSLEMPQPPMYRYPLNDTVRSFTSLNRKLISVFMARVGPAATVRHRLVMRGDSKNDCRITNVMRRLEREIRVLFPADKTFRVEQMLVVNWDGLQSEKTRDETNTFEVAVVTGGRDSFVIFNYVDISWDRARAGDPYPQAGVADRDMAYALPLNGQPSADKLESSTNVATPGMWVLKTGRLRMRGEFQNPDVKYGLELLQAIRDGLGFRQGSDPCRPSVSHLKTSEKVKVRMAQRQLTCENNPCPFKCITIDKEACCVCPEGMNGDGHQCIDLQTSKIYIRGPVRMKIGSKSYTADLSLQSRARGKAQTQGYVSFEGDKDAVSIAELLAPLFVTPLWFTAFQKDGGVNALELSGLRLRRRANVIVYGFGSFVIEQAINGLDAQFYGKWDTNITGRLRDPSNLPGAISNINMQFLTFKYNQPGLVSTKWKTLITADSKPYTVEWTEEINYFPSCPMKPVPKTFSVFTEGLYGMRTRDKQVYYMGFASVKGESKDTDPCAYPKIKCPGENEMCAIIGPKSHECKCKSGFEMVSQRCQDINECATGRHDCDANARCENQEPGYRCLCNRYYRGDGKRCERIDAICARCSRDGECQRKSQEEFVCRCRVGYEGDGFTCKPKVVDPCAKCGALSVCVNGECQCKAGLVKRGNSCFDCASGGPKCHRDGACVFDIKSYFYRCQCRPNFIGNGTHCTPKIAPICKRCDRNAECVDNSFCRCRSDYVGNGTHCVERVSAICKKCDKNAECVDNRFCRCRSSHIGNGTHCVERVSAVCRRCDRNAKCVDNRFCRCNPGYRDVNRDGFICIKDCTDKCDANAVCNLDGKCQCKSNFIGNGLTCSYDCRLCSVHAECHPITGCKCKPFFEGNGRVCAVKDECFRETDCGPNGKCNTAPIPGNERVTRRVCGCQRYFERKRGLCEPISLKLKMTPVKPVIVNEGDHVTLKCEIVEGNARVSSLMWFKERSRVLRRGIRTRSSRERRIKELIIYEARPEDTGRYICSAQGTSVYNYVTVKPNPCNRQCHERAFCNEKSGQCTCLPGNRGDGVTSCLPEVCSNFPTMCDRNAVCKKDKCICNKDYKMVGKKCERIPDCRVLKNCHKEANCVNLQGSYTCRCRNGYTGNGITSCKKAKLGCNHLNTCVENAECQYRKLFGKYMCRCKEGYFGSGDLKCRKRYDCDKNPRPCGPSSTCIKERRYDDRSGTTITVGICKCPADHKLINGLCYKSSNLNATIYVSQDSMIYQVPVVPTKTNQPRIWYSNMVNRISATIIALATDCRQRRIYWSSVNPGRNRGPSISSVLENTKGDKKAVSKDIGQVEGLAVDWIAGNIFYTVPKNPGAYIGVVNREGTNSKVIVKGEVVNPRGIAVDPSNGKIYWTDWDRSNPRIESSNMDGSERKIVIQNLRNLPNDLVYDFDQQRLCWIEADKQIQISVNSTTIKCLKPNENTPDPKQIFQENEGQPFAIAYNSPTFYYTDRQRRQLQSVTNGVRSPVKSALRVISPRMYGVTVMPEKCPPANNACSRIDNKYGGCRYLCLPVANGGKRCACPDDQQRCTPTV